MVSLSGTWIPPIQQYTPPPPTPPPPLAKVVEILKWHIPQLMQYMYAICLLIFLSSCPLQQVFAFFVHKSQLASPSPPPPPPPPPSPPELPKLQSRGRSSNVFARGAKGRKGCIILMLWAWLTNSWEGCGVKPEPLYTLHMFVASARHTSADIYI